MSLPTCLSTRGGTLNYFLYSDKQVVCTQILYASLNIMGIATIDYYDSYFFFYLSPIIIEFILVVHFKCHVDMIFFNLNK